MEDIEVSLRSYHEMSTGILSETSSWTKDLSSMPKIIQEHQDILWKRWFVEVSMEELNINPKVTNFLKNNM